MYHRTMRLYPAPAKTAKGTLWGYLNKKGEFAIPPTFSYAMDFQENGVAIVEKNNQYGLINEFGKYLVFPRYNLISDFNEGRAIVTKDDGFYVMNEKGKLLTPKSYPYISMYQDSRAMFSTISNQETLYGYLDLKGKEVIKAQYEEANDFINQKAIVRNGDKAYSLIDEQGKVLLNYSLPSVTNLGEGLLAYKENPEYDAKYGVMELKGKVIIPPTYSFIQPFQEGLAIVNVTNDFKNKYGLIDHQGNYIIQPVYNDINILGEGRIALGKAINEDEPYRGSKYALATANGAFLTDYKFSHILPYDKGYASASDDNRTFFINKSGNVVPGLPITNGSGSLTFEGDMIKAFVDERMSYYTKDGKLVWKQNTVIPLDRKYRVIEKKYKPGENVLIYYSQVSGMENGEVQQRVNTKLKKLSMPKETASSDYTYSSDFDIEFFKKELLVLKVSGYYYPIGAAHGMPSLIYPHVNLVNGTFYELQDLFLKDSNYVKVLNDMIGEKIKTDETYSYVFPDAFKGIKPEQPFYVTDKALYIYFTPYEIAPFAAGFPTFEIPYFKIMKLIDQEGEFWRAYH